MRRAICCLVLAAAYYAGAVSAADLKVEIVGLRSNDGDVHIALYDTPETFPKGDGMRVENRAGIKDYKSVSVFRDLPPGTYALATFHDENDDNRFDKNFVGYPLEGFAFSNGANAGLGPPEFSEAEITLPPGGGTASITMGYW